MCYCKKNVVEYLRGSAEQYADRLALIMPDGRNITFGGLWQDICRTATVLRSAGMKPGERMIVMIPMSIELYTVMLAIIMCGGVAVFVDPWVPLKKIGAFAAFAEPAGFAGIGRSHLLRLLQPQLRYLRITLTTGRTFGKIPAELSLPAILQSPAAVTSATSDNIVWQPASEDAPALITFTSGSSGTPKGANRTHGFLSAQYAALHTEFSYTPDDIDMPMFPVFALRNLADGITSVIPDIDFKNVAATNGAAVLKQMRTHAVTTCTASPPFIESIAKAITAGAEPVPLHRILTGGAPVENSQLRCWREAFPDTAIELVYGSTEAEPVASISLEERLAATGRGFCCGKPVEQLQTKIIRIHKGRIVFNGWEALEQSPGEPGELIVAGAHVCRDYFRNPDAIADNKLIDNAGSLWHRMGDTGFFDIQQRFRLVGRVHSTITCKEKLLHAQLVEEQVAELLPSAAKVAAVEHDENLLIIIESAPMPDFKQMLHNAGIPADRIVFTNKPLPLDPRHNAKIDYGELTRRLTKGRL